MGEEPKELDTKNMKDLSCEECEEITRSEVREKPSSSTDKRKCPKCGGTLTLVCDSLSVPHASGGPSVAKGKSKSLKDSSKPLPKCEGAFTKRYSPRKNEPHEHADTPPDKKKAKSGCAAGGGKRTSSKSPMKMFRNLIRPSKSDKVCLLEHEDDSEVSEEGLSSSTSQEPQTQSRAEPKHAELTGQREVNLSGIISVEEDSIEEAITDTTSLACSGSLMDIKGSLQSFDPVDSREGSTGDASSLEREFEELSSPSRSSQQGVRRTQTPNDSSGSEDEARIARGLCASPTKDAVLEKPGRAAGNSESEMSET